MLHLSAACNYYFYHDTTDMRKGFDSLCGIITSQMQLNALSGAIFIFINKKRNQVKLLLWEGDGLSLYHKRLEEGTYELPVCNAAGNAISVTHEQLQFILQGVALQKIVYRNRYKKIA